MRARRWLSWRIAAAILVGVMATAGIAAVWRPANGAGATLASVEYGFDTLEGKGRDGRTLWVHKYQKLRKIYLGVPLSGENLARVGDYFGDGREEVAAIVPIEGGPESGGFDHTQLDSFSGAGKLLWSFAPEAAFRFGEHELKGPWILVDVLAPERGGKRTVWAALAHHTWGNSFVVQIDPRSGRDTLRFVNTGSVRKLSELKTGDKTYLLVGGFNNEWDSGSLAIFDEARPFAASPQSDGSRHKCVSCPPGAPDYYFVFPRSELNRMEDAYEDSVFDIDVAEEGIVVGKHEGFANERQQTVYLLGRQAPFAVISRRFDSTYDALHRQWSAEGKIRHSLENCPERLHPAPVRVWTPAEGWKEVAVKPAAANQ